MWLTAWLKSKLHNSSETLIEGENGSASVIIRQRKIQMYLYMEYECYFLHDKRKYLKKIIGFETTCMFIDYLLLTRMWIITG